MNHWGISNVQTVVISVAMTTPSPPQQAQHHTTIFVAGLTLTDCLTASRQRSEVSYSLRHEGAALTRRLLTNSPTRRLQLYSPNRNCVMWNVQALHTSRRPHNDFTCYTDFLISKPYKNYMDHTAFIQKVTAAEITNKFSLFYATITMRLVLFWVTAQRVVIPYTRFGTRWNLQLPRNIFKELLLIAA